jgi:hypothetical protein
MNRKNLTQVSMAAIAALLIAGKFAAAAALHNNLISYWNMDENSGATAGDTGPAGIVADNGTLRNSPAWVSGKFGSALGFNAAGTTNVLVPNSTDMNIGANAVTISAWVKLDKLPGDPTAQTFGGILDSSTDNYVMYVDRANAQLRFKATSASNNTTVAHPGIPASLFDTINWHHVMGVYDGSAGSVKIYHNGNLIDVGSIAPITNGLILSGQVQGIGAQVATTAGNPASNYFDGQIDDLAVWSRPLGAAEAQYLYNSGAGNAVGAANSDIAPLPPLAPVMPAAQPVIRYTFDGNLANSGTGGATYDGVFHDGPSATGQQYAPTNFGQGLDLTSNPSATNSRGTTPNLATGTDNGKYVSVDYMPADQGTIELRFSSSVTYDFQTLWSNSAHGNAWEAWVYGASANLDRLAARLNNSANAGDTDFALPLVGGISQTHHIAYTWNRNGSTVDTRLYVDGELREVQMGGPWLNPGSTLFIGGGYSVPGNNQNHLGRGIYDEFKIYEAALTPAEVLYNAQIPEPAGIGLVALAAIIAFCWNAQVNIRKGRA